MTLRGRRETAPQTNIRMPMIYQGGLAFENGSDSDLFLMNTNTGNPATVYIRGYFRRNGTYIRNHFRSNASMLFVARPPAVSTYSGAIVTPGFYGQTSPTGQRRGAVSQRGYYRTMTTPQWYVRTHKLP
jgi:hypothetical protein